MSQRDSKTHQPEDGSHFNPLSDENFGSSQMINAADNQPTSNDLEEMDIDHPPHRPDHHELNGESIVPTIEGQEQTTKPESPSPRLWKAASRSPKRSSGLPPDANVIDVDMIQSATAPSSSIFGDGRKISPVVKSESEVAIKKEPVEDSFLAVPDLGEKGKSLDNAIEILDDEGITDADPLPREPSVLDTADDQPVQNVTEDQTAERSDTAVIGSLNFGSSNLTKKTDDQPTSSPGLTKKTDNQAAGPSNQRLLQQASIMAAQKAIVDKLRAGNINLSAKRFANGGSSAAGPSSSKKKDDFDWDCTDDSEEEDTGESFEAYEREFNRKKAADEIGWQEDVDFMKRRSAHQDKMNRRQLQKARQFGIPKQAPDPGTEEGLFVPDEDERAPTPPSNLKRMRDELGDSDIEDDSDVVEVDSDSPGPSSRKRRTKKAETAKRSSRKGPSRKDQRISMDAGIEDRLAKEAKKSRRGKAKDQTSQSGTSSKGTKSSRGKAKGSRSSGSSRQGRSKREGPTIPVGKKQRIELMKDFASFTRSNVYIDANENLTRGGLPEVTFRNKTEALKALIASVPEEDRRSVNLDKKQIMEASKMLGHHKGLCRFDGKGGWSLKHFIGSLKHHQVLGAAFMFERETQTSSEPYGGLCADEMGFGKTIMMIANMIANRPPEGADCKTTLIVATPGLIFQWMHEIRKFASEEVLPIIHCCTRLNQLYGYGTEQLFQHADVILTTYQMILKSYPKYEPPPEIVNPEEKKTWWEQHYREHRGLFHKTKFYRIVIDEAQSIKNHRARTSIACRGLMGKYRWAMSGTPIHNSIEELYPYFKFLHVRHTGSLETFKDNFCSKGSDITNQRLHSFLRMFMMRRTHKDTLFNAPIIKLPRNSQTTIEIEFNAVERKIYDIVKNRFMKRIENWYRDGGQSGLQKNYSNILVMLMRLRQLTSHIFLAQSTIEELVEFDDIEELWAITERETRPDNPDKALLNRMKQLISAARSKAQQASADNSKQGKADSKGKGKQKEPATTETTFSIDDIGDETGGPSTGTMNKEATRQVEDACKRDTEPLPFKFRKFLREMRKSRNWQEIAKRSVCHRCEDTPDNPYVTDCFHIYCYECLQMIELEAAEQNEFASTCLACGTTFMEAKQCKGLDALDYKGDGEQSNTSGGKRRRSSRSSSLETDKTDEESMSWITKEGDILPSSKLRMVEITVAMWLNEDQTKKIIIFTQWRLMYGTNTHSFTILTLTFTRIKIVEKLCQQKGWGHRAV